MSYKHSHEHVVYVLGAGFSRGTKTPLQSDILNDIRDLSLSDSPVGLFEKYIEARNLASDFILNAFEPDANPALEDIYTLLDQTIARRQYLFEWSWQELSAIRTALNEAILWLFHRRQKEYEYGMREFYDSLACHLLKSRIREETGGSSSCIISLNWDCVLERSIKHIIDNLPGNRFDIDYCCYTNPIAGPDVHTPSILQRAKGLLNVKMLKLHGSTNWLICPGCGRLFTGLGQKENLWEEYMLGKACPKCESNQMKHGIEKPRLPSLESFLIAPTFFKEFDNPHIRMVWHNAHLQLSCADRVVFVGYSLPESDYHLRVLLKRAIQPHTEVIAVLRAGDAPHDDAPQSIKTKYPASRYSAFFGSRRKVKIYLGGFKRYFTDKCSLSKPGYMIGAIKRMLPKCKPRQGTEQVDLNIRVVSDGKSDLHS